MKVKGSIVISGASTGIGRACALALDERGHRVFAGVRTKAASETLRRTASDRLVPIRLDVTDERSIEQAVDTVRRQSHEDPLIGLVNNAGITVNGALEFLPPKELRRQLETNLVGQLVVVQAFLPLLRRSRGRIVNVGSVSGFFTTPLLGPYCMSKHGMEALSDALRFELRPAGIHVAHLQPGAIATPIWDKGRREGEAYLETAPPEVHELYGDLIRGVRRLAERAERSAAPVDVVVRAVLHALSARRPRARYTMGTWALKQRILANLPTGWRDRVLRRMVGVHGEA